MSSVTLAAVLAAVPLIYMCVLGARALRLLQHRANTELRAPFEHFAIAVARDEKLADVYHRGLSGFASLSGTEQVQFFMIATLVFNYWTEVYIHSRRGLIPVGYWERVERIMNDFLRYPGVREYWTYRRHWFPDEVQGLIDSAIARQQGETAALYPGSVA